MYRIAILGCENSHAGDFLRILQMECYSEVEVYGVFSENEEAMEKLHQEYGVAKMASYDEAVGKVDAIMVTARHGDNHPRYAAPYMDSGIPMFIDKPITCTEEDAFAFMREARAKEIRMCGGSSIPLTPEARELAEDVRSGVLGDLISGHLVCPFQPDSEHGGFFFYAQHLAETLLAIFGYDVREVYTTVHDHDKWTFIARYDHFDVTASYVTRNSYYSASVYGKKDAKFKILRLERDYIRTEMDEMLALLQGGEMHKSYDELIRPVLLQNAIFRSSQSGKWEKLTEEKV